MRRAKTMKMSFPHVRADSSALSASSLLKGNKLLADSALESMRTSILLRSGELTFIPCYRRNYFSNFGFLHGINFNHLVTICFTFPGSLAPDLPAIYSRNDATAFSGN
jgi:hypothetical protein